MWVNQTGNLYEGDLIPGDREATEEEVAAWQAVRADELKPKRVTAGSFMRALFEFGWYDDVNTAVTTAGGLAKILFDRASSFEREHPLVAQIAAAIGKTDTDLDNLFARAADLDAA